MDMGVSKGEKEGKPRMSAVFSGTSEAPYIGRSRAENILPKGIYQKGLKHVQKKFENVQKRSNLSCLAVY